MRICVGLRTYSMRVPSTVAWGWAFTIVSSIIALAWALTTADARAASVPEVATAAVGASRQYDAGELRLADIKQGRSVLGHGPDAIHSLRAEALQESAQAYGARAGLYARLREINQMLDREASRLDGVFPFAPLLLAHNVTPPVIQVGQDTVRKNADGQLRFADAVFTLVAPAKLSLTPPDWRTYLYVPVTRPEPPDETLLPDRAQAAEVALWERHVEIGWRSGLRQADRTFQVQLARLERDLIGMARYRELLAKDMVTAPRVTEQHQGVTMTGNTLLVNDRILEIEQNTRFVTDNQRWKPYPAKAYQPGRKDPVVNVRVKPAPAPPPPAVSRDTNVARPAWLRGGEHGP